jgi:hypothetical protein
MEFHRIPGKLSNIFPSLRFREKPLASLFTANNIMVRTIPHHLIESPDFYKSAMRLLDLNTHPDVEHFAGLLGTLRLQELWLKPPAEIQHNIVDKQRLFGILGDYIHDRLQLERMLISFRGSTEWLIETLTSEEIRNFTAYPGESRPMVAHIAEILTRVINPLTSRPFLDPGFYNMMPEDSKEKLDGAILHAVKLFKRVYLEDSQPDDSVGPIECRRILTIDLGLMLSRMINFGTDKPYLDPKAFDSMPHHQKVVMGFGSPNPIYEAFKEFLRGNRLGVFKEETIYNVLSSYNYQLIRNRWEKLSLIKNRLFGSIGDN